jgi:hypothetical protein
MSPAQCFSSAYSMDGKVVAVAYRHLGDATTTIFTYNLLSRSHTYSHHVSEGRLVAPIWADSECLRFVTVKPGSITIWEAGFASIPTLVEVESLSAPDVIGHSEEYLFLPTRSWLAIALQEAVLVWDTQGSKLLLNSVSGNRPMTMAFSPDGRFFACGMTGLETFLWKESPTGYILHQKLISGIHGVIRPLISQNGESIIVLNYSIIQLWRTTDPTPPLSSVSIQSVERTAFILEISPDETMVAVARLKEDSVTVLNLKSGNSRLTVDTDMKVLGLRATGSAIVVIGEGKVVTWNIPAWDCAPDVRANINDCVRTAVFDYSPPPHPTLVPHASISPDFKHVAVTWNTRRKSHDLNVYDVSTGRCLTGATTWWATPWTTPSRREVLDGFSADRWRVAEDNESDLTKLEPPRPTAHASGGSPWRSSRGYEVRPNGWILSPSGKRLFWLPHHWRSGETYRTWGGRYLGLLHRELPAAVILEFDE